MMGGGVVKLQGARQFAADLRLLPMTLVIDGWNESHGRYHELKRQGDWDGGERKEGSPDDGAGDLIEVIGRDIA